MATELEALVGHLFVIGGRALTSPSPGAVATPPPRRSARGRDLDTFFGLVTTSSQPGEPAVFYERLSGVITEQYYANSGSITSALRETIATANAALLAENLNRDSPALAGLACAVLRESEIIVANVGSARAFLQRADHLERLPSDDELEEELPWLGQRDKPDVRFYRREVRAGDFLLLADAALDGLADGTLRQITASRDIESSLSNLRDMVGDFATVMVIQFVTPLTEEEEARQILEQARAEQQAQFRARVPAAPSPSSSAAAAQPPELSDVLLAEEASGEERNIGGVMRDGARRGALGIASVSDGLRSVIDRILPENAFGGRSMSVTVQLALAISIPILVAVLTSSVYLARGQASQYSVLVSEARSEINIAQSAGADQATARPHWETALYLLEQAERLRPEDPTLVQLRGDANAALDFYDSVTRVSLTPLREYTVNSDLRGPIVSGTDLYMIDVANNLVYREQLDETGHSVLGRDVEVIAGQNDLVGDGVLGTFVDLIWMPEGGVPQRNVLAVLTNNGLLVTYSPTWALNAALLPGGLDFTDPKAISVYQSNFYVLDAGANQIWRYEAIGDSYPNLPTPYFTESFPDLSQAIDMGIDANGNIFVLFTDGSLKKYFAGRQEGFFLEGLPQSMAGASSFYIDQNPFSPAFYLADAGGERVYQTTTTGIFSQNYKPDQGHTMRGLSGVFSDGSTNNVYLVSGNGLYRFTRP